MNDEEIQALRDRATTWVANPPQDAHADDIEDVQDILAKENWTPRRIKSLEALIKGNRTQYVITGSEMEIINIMASEIEEVKSTYPSFAMPRDATNENITKALVKAAKQNQRGA